MRNVVVRAGVVKCGGEGMRNVVVRAGVVKCGGEGRGGEMWL